MARPGGMRQRFERSVAEAESRLVDRARLEQTLAHLVTEGEVSAEAAALLREELDGQLGESRYVLRHLGAHLAIGAVFAFDMVPLPLGTIARVSWVAGSRVVETARRNRERARVHSVPVFLLAAVPWLGYAAYLLPLRQRSTGLAFVLANHTWLSRTGRTYEAFLAEARPTLRRFGRWLIPAPGAER